MKKSTIKSTFALSASLLGSAHAVIYSTETFEGGTPNYTITGGLLTQLQSGGVNITAADALAGTDYTPGSPSRSGVWANNDLPTPVVGEPGGLHGFVSNSQNRSLTLTNPMTLLSDGAASLTINFNTMLYGFNLDFSHTAAVFYSASGDFTDSVQIATYATGNMAIPDVTPPASVLGHTTIAEDRWTNIELVLTPSDVTFSDTAKIRFNKLPTNQVDHMVFYDDIRVEGTAIPEPSAMVLLGLGGLALLRRSRR